MGGGVQYYECILVSLITAKLQNPEDDVILITNTWVPEWLYAAFKKHDIKILNHTFDSFMFGDEDHWQLAYYKLSALKWAIETLDYEHFLLIDTDTVCIHPARAIWEDCKTDILLYPLSHGYYHKQVQTMRSAAEKLCEEVNIIHYGGEFIAGRREALKGFLLECESIYKQMIDKAVTTTQGDEFLISLAATLNRGHVKPASPYVRREWTGRYYDCSTAYRYEEQPIIHLPAGKGSIFSVLTRYYLKHERFPQKLGKYFCLPSGTPSLRYVLYKLLGKVYTKHLMERCK